MSDRNAEYVDVVQRLAQCSPVPYMDDAWCFFCGNTLDVLTTEPLETGHDKSCLWRNARTLVSAHSGEIDD